MFFGVFRLLWKLAVFIATIVLIYFAVTFVQVWLTSRHYEPKQAGAIVVMGAAQYDGVPSPDLAARLDQALLLYQKGYAHIIVVTGSKEKGDAYTEAEASSRYLISKGVSADDIIEVGGSDSYENLAEAAPELRRRGVTNILVVTDPFHEDRSLAIASALGLDPSPDADADIAHQGSCDDSIFPKGDRRRRSRPYHRLQSP